MYLQVMDNNKVAATLTSDLWLSLCSQLILEPKLSFNDIKFTRARQEHAQMDGRMIWKHNGYCSSIKVHKCSSCYTSVFLQRKRGVYTLRSPKQAITTWSSASGDCVTVTKKDNRSSEKRKYMSLSVWIWFNQGIKPEWRNIAFGDMHQIYPL